MDKRAVVLLSGGLDSATCLALAKARGFACYALTFDYGQRHAYELAAAKKVAQSLGAIEHKIMPLNLNLFGGSALTDNSIDVPQYDGSTNIPLTYVPARNTIFLSIALAYAEVVQANEIIIGASCVDYSHYPDCRPEYFSAFQALANLATKVGVEGTTPIINTPLLHLSKAETIQAGHNVDVDYSLTVSCYQTDVQGRACGECDSCYLRRKGFHEAGVADLTLYVNEAYA